jgi:hypothetical protein
MSKYLWAMLAIVTLLSGGCSCSRHPGWTYKGEFHDAIAKADRVVIIDGGFDCYGHDSKVKTLFELSEPAEIQQFAERLEFQKGQALAVCPCNGYPRVDWYKGKERLALVSIQHGQAVRWKGFHADAKLTSKSSRWLQQWLAEHGVDPAKMK